MLKLRMGLLGMKMVQRLELVLRVLLLLLLLLLRTQLALRLERLQLLRLLVVVWDVLVSTRVCLDFHDSSSGHLQCC